MTALTNALVIDDHPLFRDALATAIGLSFPGSQTRGVDSIDAALRVLDEASTSTSTSRCWIWICRG